ncbi:hypothetical protein NKR23_g11027 [Pleurostoma richardsiae]|uniref:NmrA-like domain-containing protein n=1 Tax=Pleurostoma richardsiae TaxID=41990 RepID=A0AA38VKM5_9PEZI|nr:hypothetical protein NKR23_g11027 [Pleurostoma richardsiae]
MLILIPGITGALGGHIATSALSRGHTLRGLGRSPKALSSDITSRLESFFELESYYDISALERACHGVDAIICALRSTPELELDVQLLLLRAAEKAGIKIFVASTWNNDWTRIGFGAFEHYDAHISFKRQAEISSPIRPVYLFTGTFAEYLLSFTCFHVVGKTDDSGKKIEYWEDPSAPVPWTSMRDAAEFTLEVLNDEGVKQGKGGRFSFQSGVTTASELAKTYTQVTGGGVELVRAGSEEELAALAYKRRSETDVRDYLNYAILFYHLYTLKQTWKLRDVREYPQIRRTGLEEAVTLALDYV